MKILSPYPDDRRAVTDWMKLARSDYERIVREQVIPGIEARRISPRGSNPDWASSK